MTTRRTVTRDEFDALRADVAALLTLMRESNAAETAPKQGTKSPAQGAGKTATADRDGAPWGTVLATTGKGAFWVCDADEVGGDARIVADLPDDVVIPAHCTAMTRDGVRRCPATESLDAHGRCPTHTHANGGQQAPSGLVSRRVGRELERKYGSPKGTRAKATKATGTAKVAPKGRRASGDKPTCQGTRTNGEPCGSTVGLVDGYCRQHRDQAAPKGRRSNTKRQSPKVTDTVLRAADV